LILHHYWRAASAQYLHNIVVGLEVLILGMASGDAETGLFGLAFVMAVQANSVISYQLGQVLQPIFGHLQMDPVRQVAGFLKAQSVLSAVSVPICLAQALLAEPLFNLAFAPKWRPAIPVFQVVSLAQALYFATGPSMACLRAQRRFGTFLVWQAAQLLLSIPIYWVGARNGGAVGVALASAGVWAASSPVVVWLCTLAAGRGRLTDSILIFVRPWIVGIPIFLAAHLMVRWLVQWGAIGDAISIACVGPTALLATIWAVRYLSLDIRQTIDGLCMGAWRRLRRRSAS
jgi:O-antigen/teichoic acid export membrane protein